MKKRPNSQYGNRYRVISLLFLASIVSIGASAAVAFAGSSTVAIVLVAAGLCLLAASLVLTLLATLRADRHTASRTDSLSTVEKTALGVSATEILFWIFLAP